LAQAPDSIPAHLQARGRGAAMAATMGESPESRDFWLEVPEPDLSMEVQNQLKTDITELESECAKEETRLRRSALARQAGRRGPGAVHQEAPGGALVPGQWIMPGRDLAAVEAEALQTRYAEAAVMEMVSTLRSFDPEISCEKLSNDILCIVHSDAVVGHMNERLKASLRAYVPRNRRAWLAQDIEGHIAARRATLRLLRAKLARSLTAIWAFGGDPTARAAAFSAGGGAVLLGSAGGALGLALGTASGAVCGASVVPFTFGLSLPVGSAVGGSLGACVGVATGATTGLIGGGVAGGVAHRYRLEIRDGAVNLRGRVGQTAICTRTQALETTNYVKVRAIQAAERVQAAAVGAAHAASAPFVPYVDFAKTKGSELGAGVRDVVLDGHFQTTAASAAGGAVIAGTGGAVAGLAAGTTIGVVCGIVPAVFTFGLSIPVGAAIGAGTGAFAGTAAGSAVGFVGGGATGYGIYARHQDIRDSASNALRRVSYLTESVKEKANTSASYMKARLVGGTGGTA